MAGTGNPRYPGRRHRLPSDGQLRTPGLTTRGPLLSGRGKGRAAHGSRHEESGIVCLVHVARVLVIVVGAWALVSLPVAIFTGKLLGRISRYYPEVPLAEQEECYSSAVPPGP